MTRVLIVGSGAREHALAWKLRRSDGGDRLSLHVAPGNAGTAGIAENVPIAATDPAGIVRFVEERDVDLTVVGPEAPLAAGLGDLLRARGRTVVGPGARAARIESSKAFAKDLMIRAGVPTAAYRVFDEPGAALRFVGRAEYPLVVKADGLAAGKGVTVCAGPREAEAAIGAMMIDRVHGTSGARVVIEEALAGPEVSLLAFVDGERVVPLPLAQDHKRLGERDTGPNTGGMGAYAPVPFLGVEDRDRLADLVLRPVVEALAREGEPYRGVLFAGLMLTESGPRVLEYNCRFGDPEAQVILPLLDGDLLPWLEAVAGGRLDELGPVHIDDRVAVGVVLAAEGYPEKPRTGVLVEGLADVPRDVLVFHAGTAVDAGGRVVTAGGRVATVVATGATIEEAARRAYQAPVHFAGMQRRGDIGWQARYGLGDSIGHPVGAITPEIGEAARPRIGVLASGEGSNLQALLDACDAGELPARVAVVVSHRADARALERARRAGVPAHTLPMAAPRDWEARRRHEEELLEVLRPYRLDLIVLAGWMLILSRDFLERCPCPILNVHPALLPLGEPPHPRPLSQIGRGESYRVRMGEGVGGEGVLRGAHAVRDALSLGLRYTGVSVHHVTAQVDAGPVVVREIVAVEPGDDEESLYRRIKAVEHRLLPQAVQTVLSSQHYGGVHA